MPETLIPNQSTLIKYESPFLVASQDDLRKGLLTPKSPPVTPPVAGFPQIPKLPGIIIGTESSVVTSKETEEILNRILPPKEWLDENGRLWRQPVSSVPTTRIDVINLQEHLDMKIKQRQAKESGICPLRRELYSQCFEELIRQVTINCGERGMLLLRVRDELNMTLNAYRSLFESSTAFGLRKAASYESAKIELEEKIQQQQNENLELERLIQGLKVQIDQTERKYADLMEAEEKKFTQEIQFLKRSNQQIKQQLEAILNPKKSDKN